MHICNQTTCLLFIYSWILLNANKDRHILSICKQKTASFFIINNNRNGKVIINVYQRINIENNKSLDFICYGLLYFWLIKHILCNNLQYNDHLIRVWVTNIEQSANRWTEWNGIFFKTFDANKQFKVHGICICMI